MISYLLCFRQRGIGIPFFYLDDTSLSLSQLFGVSIEELLGVFETIGFFKKVNNK